MLKPVNIDNIPCKYKRNGNGNYIQREIEDFIASGEHAAEIVIPDNRTARAVYTSYGYAIKAKSYPLRVMRRGSRVFLVREAENA